MPAVSAQRMKAGNHTFAIANQPSRLALLERSDNSQKLCPMLEPQQGQPDTFTSVNVTNPTPTKVWIAIVSSRSISPHSVDTKRSKPGNQSRLMINQHLLSRSRQQTMKFNTGGVPRAEAGIPTFRLSALQAGQ
eukprot:1519794-Amphidinium_carterae.1